MKAIRSVTILTTLLLIQSCGNKEQSASEKTGVNPRATRSYEIINGDTVNRNDVSKRRQGPWKIIKPIASTKTIQAVYAGEPGIQTKILKYDIDYVKLEEGSYIDGKREGLWKRYFPSGKFKDSVTYKDDIAVR